MRHHFIDGLRNLAILYLFPYHTARIFDRAEPYYVEGTPSPVTTALIAVSYWFMPLLFLLAGMASLHGLRKRSAGGYVRERVLRLLVPLAFGVVVLVPPQAYAALAFHDGSAPAYPAFLAGYFADWSDLTGYFGTFTPGQLWFVAFLLVISLGLVAPMSALARRGHRATWLAHPVLVLLPAVGLAALSALPDLGGQNVAVYAGFFFAGFLLATDDAALEALVRRRRLYLGVALGGAVAVLVERATIGWQSGSDLTGIAFTVGHFAVGWVTLLALVGLGRRHLDRPSAVMRYLTAAAFPVFVLHQTVLVAVGYVVLAVVEPVLLQYALVVTLSAVLTFGAYEALRRVGPLRFLLGMKAAPARRRAAGDGVPAAVPAAG